MRSRHGHGPFEVVDPAASTQYRDLVEVGVSATVEGAVEIGLSADNGLSQELHGPGLGTADRSRRRAATICGSLEQCKHLCLSRTCLSAFFAMPVEDS